MTSKRNFNLTNKYFLNNNKKLAENCSNLYSPSCSKESCDCNCQILNRAKKFNFFNKVNICTKDIGKCKTLSNCTSFLLQQNFNAYKKLFYKIKLNHQKKLSAKKYQTRKSPKWQQMYKIIFLLLLIIGNLTQISSHYYSHNKKITASNSLNNKSPDYENINNIHSSFSINLPKKLLKNPRRQNNNTGNPNNTSKHIIICLYISIMSKNIILNY